MPSTPQPRLAALLRRAFAPHAATSVVELRTAGWTAAPARPAARVGSAAPQRELSLSAA
jgi:hypothetical protein